MKIKMTHTMAGPEGITPIGRVIDVPEQKAVQLVGDGYAEYAGPVAQDISAAPEVTLDDMMYKDLQAACRKAGVSDKGKKKELRARLKALEEVDDDQPSVDERAVLPVSENTALR